ncbi:nitrate reductase cytochrome c-type subunit [Marilutibacter chinensis]|uniref:Periplasmic nitrate reductase, electron transfer subunit n=1 Tax=Marilutibacter chinensis TaxID=2912247 RepID=A0ABS9HWW0_9GAMM|nr:nitrate reductase cytochrome c-type subunit [Lysobacter chinensis]MCF7223379.1 nitrate reductase cytochrome c-type subunit [Lysobacter chinensis]
MAILLLAAAVAVLLGIVIALSFRLGDRKQVASVPPAAPVAEHVLPHGSQIDAMRRGIPIDEEATPLPMARVLNTDLKRERGYPMQPPTIPHSIDNYQVTVNTNRCMLCHARANAADFQAPPVSVTHYMDRDDQFLATISPRRYFCNQCHVVQTDAQPLVANGFRDIDTVLAAEQAAAGGDR